MKKVMILALLVLALNTPAIADDMASWENEAGNLQKLLSNKALPNNEKCQKTWDLLWPQAKEGNLEAREHLFFFSLAMPHNDTLQMPGSGNNFIARMHDGLILAVHSAGVQYKQEIYVDVAEGFFTDLGLEKTEFYKCFKQNLSTDCSRLAVEEGLVPSFDEFAANIDFFVEQGRKPQCLFNPKSE